MLECDENSGMYNCFCDHCGNETELFAKDFNEAVNVMRELGVVTKRKDRNTVLNFCDEECYRNFCKQVAKGRSSHRNLKNR